MRLRGLGLGRVGMEKLKNSHKGGCCVKISHSGCVVRILHKAIFTHPNAKLWSFQMEKILGFLGWEIMAEVGKGFFMVARLGNWSFSRREFGIWRLLYSGAMGFL